MPLHLHRQDRRGVGHVVGVALRGEADLAARAVSAACDHAVGDERRLPDSSWKVITSPTLDLLDGRRLDHHSVPGGSVGVIEPVRIDEGSAAGRGGDADRDDAEPEDEQQEARR